MKQFIFIPLLCIFLSSSVEGQYYTKVTTGPVVNDAAETFGGTWADYDNDGDLDLFVNVWAASLNNLYSDDLLYQNNCNGELTRVLAIPGGLVSDGGMNFASIFIDYNNDGFEDLFVTTNDYSPNRLYLNNGNGTFSRILDDPIVSDTGYNRGTSWADYDHDGFLDCYIARLGYYQLPPWIASNSLYHNNGNGSFTRVLSGNIATDSIAFTGVWGDYDNDGDMDMLAIRNPMFFYRNEGNGVFNKISLSPITTDYQWSFGGSWADYDNDLDLDLLIINTSSVPTRLYRNDGSSNFINMATSSGIPLVTKNNDGHAWGDYDNDGDLDLLLACWDGKNFLCDNNGNGAFTVNTTEIVTTETVPESYGSNWVDFDNDGDLDLYIATAYGAPNDLFYVNNGNNNSWVNIRCIGILSNRNAVGTRVYVKANISGYDRWQMREINANCNTAQGGPPPLRTHFGLGDATIIDTLKLVWPKSGITQIFANVNVNRFIEITEGINIIFQQQKCKPDLPPKELAFITGTVFNDIDSNCVFESLTDFFLSNRMIEVTPGPFFVFSGGNGGYEFKVPEGDDYKVRQVKFYDDPFKELDCPSTDSVYEVSVGKGDTVSGNNFFDVAKKLLPCGPYISIIGDYGLRTSPCPGEIATYCITYDNTGKAPITEDGASGFVTFQIDVVPVIAAIVPGSITASADCNCTPSLTGNTITCQNSATFATNKICKICFDVDVPPDPPFITGAIITTTAVITGECPGATPFSEQTSLDDPADCAYDPNDKLVVNPEGCGPFGNIKSGETFVYRVRFQNVGTAPAYNIVIRDVLDSDLDITTLRILGTSHLLTSYEIIPDNVLILMFQNINLPDSFSDPEGSNGFAFFSIKPKNNLPDGTEITNQAGIYFDFNDVVLTNTTLNTIRDNPFPIVDFEARHSCTHAEPVFDFFYTGGTADSAEFEWDFGPDATPQTSTDENPAGIVFSGTGQKNVTLTVTRFGCESVIAKTVEVIAISCGNNNNKILVCHIPPGNPEKPQLLCVDPSSLAAHITHGDCIGVCPPVTSKMGIDYLEEKNEISNLPLSSQNKDDLSEGFFIAYPNPFGQMVTITFALPAIDHVTVSIYNYIGQKVVGLFDDYVVESNKFYSIKFESSDLPIGLYNCVIRTSMGIKTLRITVIR